jgi:pyridoxal phosphate enzyme (YggS family)
MHPDLFPESESREPMTVLSENIKKIKKRIHNAALACGRNPEEVRLVAVTKTVGPERIRQAADCGLQCFGENYIQEAREKIKNLADVKASWHFIGHLQSNKAKYAVKLFDLIHSVDSLKLALELNRYAEKQNTVQKILIQVNTGEEQSKSGTSPHETENLIESMSELENILVCGLMTIPPYFDAPEKVRPFFRSLARLKKQIAARSFKNVEMKELSMGMTGDFEAAIEQGATMVRIGTAIFGKRL